MLSFKQFLFENQYEGLLPTGMIPGDSSYIHHGDLMVGNQRHPAIEELYKKYGPTGVYHYNTKDNMHGFVLGPEAESMHAAQPKETDPTVGGLDQFSSAEEYLNRKSL